MKKRSSKTTAILIIILAVVTASSFLVYYERQNIADWWALLGYHPSEEVASLANQDGMTPYTRKVFYVNHPQVDSKAAFYQACPGDTDQMVVLGCYHPPQKGIYLLNVNEAQLHGLVQVTAAYETLHAIYQRLSPSALKTLNSQLISFENSGLSSPEVKAQIANFRKTEPGDVLNEMTSLFGTEVQNLPPGLSAFYSYYFSSRQTLLNYYNDYQAAFTTRENAVNSDDAQLTSLGQQIKTDKTQLGAELEVIDNEQTALNSEQSSGQVSEYNSAVPGYNQQVASYNALIATLKGLISQYNQIVAARNALALEEQQLVADITSSPSSISN